MPAELRFRAMGTAVHLLALDVPVEVLQAARHRIADLESRWSRFLPASEVSQINRHPTRWTTVSPGTFRLIEAAVRGWELTAGAFDPTVLRALVAAGYDRSFELVREGQGSPTQPAPAPQAAPSPIPAWVPGAGAIELDEARWAVRLVEGVGIDLGGIAKGHAADLVVADLMAAGASGAMADLGGDVRVAGVAPTPRGWRVAAANPVTGGPAVAVDLAAGAVVTSARTGRRWMAATGEQHHLIDPRTGTPATTGLASVSVVASSAMWAEVVAKAAFVLGAGDGATLVERMGATGWFVHDDGRLTALAGLGAYRVPHLVAAV